MLYVIRFLPVAPTKKKKKRNFRLRYRRYTDTAVIRTLVRHLPAVDRTLKEFVFSKYRQNKANLGTAACDEQVLRTIYDISKHILIIDCDVFNKI